MSDEVSVRETFAPPPRRARLHITLGSWPLLLVSLLSFAACWGDFLLKMNSLLQRSLWNPPSTPKETQNVIYGHLHVAKTAGTNLNGNLSMHFERICGHKGYSFDAFTTNERFKMNKKYDSYGKVLTGYNRGRVPPIVMDEIGYHDCDWISSERRWQFWPDHFSNWPLPLELHVPCRSPLEHLMSQCNFQSIEFDCNKTGADMIRHVQDCLVFIKDRFDKQLVRMFPVKCFDVGRMNEYMEWIGEKLERKKIEGEYTFRASNKPRNASQECIWKHIKVQEIIKSYLIESYDYYAFCNECIGSDDDVLSSLPQKQ